MSEYIHKAHNVSVLLYHYVCPAKYRRVIFDDKVDKVLIQTCKEISKRYDINIMEIGTDGDYVHFLIQSVPMLAPHGNSENNKKYNSARNISVMSTGEEKAVGRQHMERWIFCRNSK